MDASRKLIRILISDDHTLFREALRKVFELEKHFLVVGEARDGEETLELVKQLKPDILLLSWQLPELSITDILRSISSYCTKTQTILLAEEIDWDQIAQAFQFGARGLVLKESSAEVLFSSMRSIVAGQYWMVSESFSSVDLISKKLDKNTPGKRKPENFALTPQELKIIAAVASGCTNKVIAKQLSISEQTAKHHITNIFDKLGVYNRLELTLFAVHHKLIKDSD
jgi:two-component system, NarL family, nitrate/nitrite response regulator NarL